MRRTAISLLTLLLFATTLVATGTPASAGGTCTTNPYPTSSKARDRFEADCGQPFRQTTEYRCDWTPAGWECSGPGTRQSSGGSSSGSSNSSSQSATTPTIIQAEYNGRYTSLVWRNLPKMKGVNVYRNGSFQTSVPMPGNVYNDFRGKAGDEYYVTAYSHSSDISQKSNKTRADVTTPRAMRNLKAKQVGKDRVHLTWDRGSDSVDGWRVFRNGKHMWDRKASGRPIMVDYKSAADQISYYEVQPYKKNYNGKLVWGPKAAIHSPILKAMTQRSHGQKVDLTPTGGQTGQKAQDAKAAMDAYNKEVKLTQIAAAANLASWPAFLKARNYKTAVAVVTTGYATWRQLKEAEHAYLEAMRKIEEFNRCKSSSSCNGSGGGDGGDTLAPGDYHDATLDQIPGQPTQVSAD